MLCLLIDLIAVRLKYTPPPYGLLQVLTQVTQQFTGRYGSVLSMVQFYFPLLYIHSYTCTLIYHTQKYTKDIIDLTKENIHPIPFHSLWKCQTYMGLQKYAIIIRGCHYRDVRSLS